MVQSGPRGSSSVGRALAFQAGGREFESLLPLHMYLFRLSHVAHAGPNAVGLAESDPPLSSRL